MEEVLKTYEGPAVIDGEEVPNLRLRVITEHDDGVTWPDEPRELLRSWEAEVSFPYEHPSVWTWQNATQGVEVAIPGNQQKGRARAYDLDRQPGDGAWVVRLVGEGPPPVDGI
ncbi:hypothetical protein [Streptomyces omiyaensis]|uniref:hypothetical protein n=1 Tax=Streptomyces omiyaensis TaxID=68247 RepID=UPI0036F9303B